MTAREFNITTLHCFYNATNTTMSMTKKKRIRAIEEGMDSIIKSDSDVAC